MDVSSIGDLAALLKDRLLVPKGSMVYLGDVAWDRAEALVGRVAGAALMCLCDFFVGGPSGTSAAALLRFLGGFGMACQRRNFVNFDATASQEVHSLRRRVQD